VIDLVDPCLLTTIDTLNADGDLFSNTDVTALTPKMITSVLVGTEINPSGTLVTEVFNIQSDDASRSYFVAGTPFVCGPRVYNIAIEPQDDGTTSFSTFVFSQDIDDLTKSISAVTGDDGDIGLWKILVTVSLEDYPSVTALSQWLYIKIEYCILNEIVA
jgi:hypothetical protein